MKILLAKFINHNNVEELEQIEQINVVQIDKIVKEVEKEKRFNPETMNRVSERL